MSFDQCNRPAVRRLERAQDDGVTTRQSVNVNVYQIILNSTPSLFLSTSTWCIVVHKICKQYRYDMDWFTRYSYETVGAIKAYFSTRCIKSNKDSPKVRLVAVEIREIKLSSLLWKRVSPNRVKLGFNKKFKEADQQ